MMTSEEYNEKMRGKYKIETRTGVQCPDCFGELIDTNPGSTLLSSPPQKRVHCSKCGYKGYITV